MSESEYLTFGQLSTQHFVPVGWYRDVFRRDFFMNWHTHRQFEIMYCEKGTFMLDYMIAGKKATEHVCVSEKNFILLNAGYYHRIRIEVDDTQIFNVELFPAERFEAGEPKLLRNVSPPAREIFALNAQLSALAEKNERFYLFNDTQDVGATLKKLIEELGGSDAPASSLPARILLLELFIGISRCKKDDMIKTVGLTPVRKALFFMQQNYMESIDVEDIAAAADISPAYLQRLFRTELKEGVHTTLTGIRLQNAKNLLKTTSLSNAEIAQLSGFRSRESLIYAFRRFEGCTPHDYRRSCRVKSMRTYPWPQDEELTED